MTKNAKIRKIAATIQKMEDGGTALAWAAYDANLLTYEHASPPANLWAIGDALVNGWAGESDTVGDLLGELESEAPKATAAIWNALLG